jgi:hypothetical protein
MKQLSILLSTTIAFIFLSASSSNNKEITKIRSRFEEIQINLQDKTYNIKKLSDCNADFDAIAYVKEGKTDMIMSEISGEAGRIRYEYYYDKENQLIFVLQQFYKYNRPMSYDEATAEANQDDEYFDPEKTKILENRFYYSNQKLIYWTNEDEKMVKAKHNDYFMKSRYFIGRSLELLAKSTEFPKNDQIISKHQQNSHPTQLARGESTQRRAGGTRL